MRHKFAVDELVLLRSEEFPECNGDCIVLDIKRHDEYGWIYKLTIQHEEPGYSDYWKETALRKKHTPGEMSFDDLMQSLSSPKLLTHQPQ